MIRLGSSTFALRAVTTAVAILIGGKLLGIVAAHAPLRRNITIEDVGNTAAFLLSDLASCITSEITYVDVCFSHVMYAPEE